LARIEWLEKLNMPYEEIESNNIILPVVKCELKFIKPLIFGDIFFIKVFCSKKPTSTIEFTYEIFNDKNEITTEGKTSLAFVDSLTRKPLRCPNMIGKLFE
jgi:acyl-CoA thioester hydrolase